MTSKPLNPIYFWKPDDPDLGWLSQWYKSYFQPPNSPHDFCNAEQWMMYQKALLFNDSEIAAAILKTDDPRQHKRLGRQVKGYDDDVWNENKLRIVTEGSYHKFAHSTMYVAESSPQRRTASTTTKPQEDLKAKLLATGNRPLVEASPLDRIWGIGFSAKNAEASRNAWGENLLGIALETAREKIRVEEGARKSI